MVYNEGILRQLETAADFVCGVDPYDWRVGLILADNAAELLVDREAMAVVVEAMAKHLMPGIGAPAPGDSRVPDWGLTLDVRLGLEDQRYPLKVKALVELGIVAQDDAAFLLACHELRNVAYHEGEHHPRYVVSVAKILMSICCELLATLKSSTRFGPPPWRAANAGDALGATKARVVCRVDQLCSELSQDLGVRLARILDWIDRLTVLNPALGGRAGVMEWANNAQLHHLAWLEDVDMDQDDKRVRKRAARLIKTRRKHLLLLSDAVLQEAQEFAEEIAAVGQAGEALVAHRRLSTQLEGIEAVIED